MSRRLVPSPFAFASAAVVAGSAFLYVAGAPPRMPLMNVAALLIGLAIVKAAAALRSLGARPAIADFAFLGAALLIPLTALFGSDMNGVSRWLIVAGITVLPGLIVVPPLVVGFARRPSPVRGAAIAVASVGLAMQPDPAAASMLALGVALTLAMSANRRASSFMAVLLASCASLAVALAREVALPPVPFVEGVLQLALDAGPLAAGLAAATLCLLFLPTVGDGSAPRSAVFAFTGLWLAGIASALIGNYPAPVVGFGGSAVLGYVLSVAVLRQRDQPSAYAGHWQQAGKGAEKADPGVHFA